MRARRDVPLRPGDRGGRLPRAARARRGRADRLGIGDRVATQVAELPDGLGDVGVDAAADIVWTSHVLHHLGDQQAAVAQVATLVRPGGLLAVVEGGLPTRTLPRDIGIGRPGLEARLDVANTAWFAAMRDDLPDTTPVVEHWPRLLTDAGLELVGSRTFLLDQPAPLDASAREYVERRFADTREHLDEWLDPEDRTTLDLCSTRPRRSPCAIETTSSSSPRARCTSVGRADRAAAACRVTYETLVAALRAAGCVFAEDEATLIIEAADGRAEVVDAMAARRRAGEPLELVIGYADFGGVRVAIRPGVFVPRQRSVALVDAVAAQVSRIHDRRPVVVDLGCGTGALLMALLASVDCTGFAIDRSAEAAHCARENLAGTDAVVITGTGLGALPAHALGQVDVIMANLPYVPTAAIATLPREARLYEPWSTLDGGPDGLAPLAEALPGAAEWLRADGHYLGELHESQVDAAIRLADRHGFTCASTVDPDTATAIIDLTLDPTAGSVENGVQSKMGFRRRPPGGRCSRGG